MSIFIRSWKGVLWKEDHHRWRKIVNKRMLGKRSNFYAHDCSLNDLFKESLGLILHASEVKVGPNFCFESSEKGLHRRWQSLDKYRTSKHLTRFCHEVHLLWRKRNRGIPVVKASSVVLCRIYIEFEFIEATMFKLIDFLQTLGEVRFSFKMFLSICFVLPMYWRILWSFPRTKKSVDLWM